MEQENLIQIIGYRESLNKETGKPYTWQKHFDIIKVTSAFKLFKNLDKIIELIPENDRWNCHYTIANCYPADKSKTKPLRVFHHQEIIAFDIDGNVDIRKELEYREVIGRVCGVDTSKMFIGCSGNGLHYCMVLKDHIDSINKYRSHLIKLAELINIEITLKGLPGTVDTQRFTESATLRLIGTKNVKKGIEKDSYVIQNNVEELDFDITKIIDLPLEEYVETEYKLRPVDHKAVASGCKFLVSCLEEPHTVKEPQWYAMLGILAYIPDIGETLCHTYSNKHPDYTVEETNEKIKHALKLKKPRTCDSIGQVYSKCSQCPYYGKVKSPLHIKSEEFIPTESTGFHTEIVDSKGGIKYVPNYDDLVKYFNKLHTFITNIDTHQLMKYDGKKWIIVEDLEITAFATKHFNPTAKNTMRAEFLGIIKNKKISSKNFTGKDNNNFINFDNGVLNIKTRELLPHSEDYGFTYCLPYAYNPNATCPNFDAMMSAVTLADKDLENVILEFVGLAISGRPNSWVQKVMVLSGEGSNGKSTFMNIIRKLVGEDCYSAVSLASMAKENTRYNMLGKLFNISFDEDPKALLKGGVNVFKAISAGDPVDIKKLYSDPISAPINSKLIVACNKPLETNDHTHAVYRRMLIIPFRAKFEGATDNKNIAESMGKEMSGIYNRVLDGLDRLIENEGNFSNSKIVTDALKEYKQESAVFQRFFDDSFETTDDKAHFVSNQEIMGKFKSWCELNNENLNISSTVLLRELKSLSLLKTEASDTVKNKRGYRGIREFTNF